MIPHIDLLISPWFEIRITWSLHCWIALIKDCLSYTNHHVPFVVIDKLFSKISESTKHLDTFATHCISMSYIFMKWYLSMIRVLYWSSSAQSSLYEQRHPNLDLKALQRRHQRLLSTSSQ